MPSTLSPRHLLPRLKNRAALHPPPLVGPVRGQPDTQMAASLLSLSDYYASLSTRLALLQQQVID